MNRATYGRADEDAMTVTTQAQADCLMPSVLVIFVNCGDCLSLARL
jgi:hypothetical protein